MSDKLTDEAITSDKLRENAAVLLGPSGNEIALASIAGALQLAASTIDGLQDLLRETRSYVTEFYAANPEQESEREVMLQRVDNAAPPPPIPPMEFCEKSNCSLLKGHTGECDELPF